MFDELKGREPLPPMLAIMQPYFLPYIGHFSLLMTATRWIIFDLPKYAPKTYVSRNWLRLPMGQVVRLGLSVNHRRGQKINEAEVASLGHVMNSIDGPLRQHFPYSPHAKPLHERLMDCLCDCSSTRVVDINQALLSAVAEMLGFERPMQQASQLELNLDGVSGAGEWAPTIAAQLGCKDYVNPPVGASFLDPDRFESAGVTLWFHRYFGPRALSRDSRGERNLTVLNDILERGANQVRMDLLLSEVTASRTTPMCPRGKTS